MPRDVDGLVDEIDRLVDEQLAHGEPKPERPEFLMLDGNVIPLPSLPFNFFPEVHYSAEDLQPMHPLNAIPAAVAAVAVLGAIIWPVLLVRELWDRVTGAR